MPLVVNTVDIWLLIVVFSFVDSILLQNSMFEQSIYSSSLRQKVEVMWVIIVHFVQHNMRLPCCRVILYWSTFIKTVKLASTNHAYGDQ